MVLCAQINHLNEFPIKIKNERNQPTTNQPIKQSKNTKTNILHFADTIN